MFARERARLPFGYDWTQNLTGFTRLQVAFRVPIKCDDDMIGDWQFQAGFKLSAEDFPVRLSATVCKTVAHITAALCPSPSRAGPANELVIFA